MAFCGVQEKDFSEMFVKIRQGTKAMATIPARLPCRSGILVVCLATMFVSGNLAKKLHSVHCYGREAYHSISSSKHAKPRFSSRRHPSD